MYWKLIVNQQMGALELLQGEAVLERCEWQENRKTSEEIFVALQELLHQTGLTYQQVPELRLELDLPPHATARRIAETVQNVYNTFVSYEGS